LPLWFEVTAVASILLTQLYKCPAQHEPALNACYQISALVGFDAEKAKKRIVAQDFAPEDIDQVMRDMQDLDIEQLGDSISAPNSDKDRIKRAIIRSRIEQQASFDLP
jgi:hypothetical protein